MNKKYLKIFLLIILISMYGVAQSQVSKQSIASRIHNMSRLLNESSGARQVISSSNSEAKQKRQKALELYRQANEKHNNGAIEDAEKLLNQSVKLMFDAIKMSTPNSMAEDNKSRNYRQIRRSVIALRAAFNRISGEKNTEETKHKVESQLDQLITQADELLKIGEYTGAGIEIGKAYHLLKVSIDSIRSGQTLVRSLQFESKEKEYKYEVDRNDSYSMLINLLVDEKSKTGQAKEKFIKFVEKAKLLRQQAEAYAGEDAYEIAIGLLEQSTEQFVRGIRSVGIYIPG